MKIAVSLIIVFGVAITAAIFIGFIARNEHIGREKVTGNLGMPVLIGFTLIFVVAPVLSFLSGDHF